MSNKEFVEFTKRFCTDQDFVAAIEGFYLDSQNDEVKQKALQRFCGMVTFDNEGKPSRDEVELLDVYEGMLG